MTMFSSDSSLHLKPLSVYSHMVCSRHEKLYNIKVHITNNESRGQKRRLDSCLDEICETPRKKPCITRSCSQDLGYFSSDFPSGVQGSTPLQTLLISKDVTPPRSEVNQSLTPVVSTPLYKSTPLRTDRDRESLPSPIPVLKWDREVSSAELKCGSLNFSASVPAGAGEVRGVSLNLVSVREAQSGPSAVPVEEEEVVSVSQQAEPEVTDRRGESAGESFESTLPLQVQVKSKVVVPDNTQTVCKPAVSCSEEAWQRNKRTYVDSVTRHMREQSGAANGVITELHSLMNSVASQKAGRSDPHWQHPSDLTRRNFRQARLKGPSASLDEWQKRNLPAYRRFANVPDIFHRSPVL